MLNILTYLVFPISLLDKYSGSGHLIVGKTESKN